MLTSRSPDAPDFCDPTGLDWAIVVLVLASVSFTWWLWETPALFRHGFAEFFRRVAWQALRVISPSFVACKALAYRTDYPADWVGFYYFGAYYQFDSEDRSRRDDFSRVKGWRYVLVALYEVPAVVTAVLCAYRWSIIGPAVSGYRPVPPEWIAACLPPMVVGVCLLITSKASSRWDNRSRHSARPSSTFKYIVCGATLTALLVVGVAYILTVYFGPPRSDPELATRPTELTTAIVWYVVVGIPLPLLPLVRKNMMLQVIALLPAAMGRAYGFTLGTTGLGKFQDEGKCWLFPRKWTGAMIAFGVLSFVMGFIGILFCETVCLGDQRSDGNTGGEAGNNTATTATENVPLEPQTNVPLEPQDSPPQYAEAQTQTQAYWRRNSTSSSHAVPLRRDSDTEALLQPPPPYTPSRSPTYVEGQ